MTGKLWPTLKHQAGESPASFASRLAALHHVPVWEFCRDMGIAFQRIVDGARDAVEALADLAGQARAPLVAQAVVRTGETTYVWHGQELTRASLRRADVMVCPLCLAEDVATAEGPPTDAAYGRTVWQLRAIRTCQRHDVALVLASHAGARDLTHDFAKVIGPVLDRVVADAATSERRPRSAFEGYLLGRLDEDPAEGWLDRLPWHAAAETCQMIGAVALHGPRVATSTLTDVDWHAAADAGFAVSSDGEAGIVHLLTHLDATYPRSRAATEGPQAVYGALQKWLREGINRPELEPLRAVMTDHVVRSTPIGPGDLVFGRPVERRVLHSIRTAALEWDRHPKRLRKILRASGLIGPETDGLNDDATTFDATAAAELLERAARSIPQKAAESYLNAGRVQTAMLVREGLITPFVCIGTARRRKMNLALADLDAFLARLLAGSVIVPFQSEGECTIPQACRRANRSSADLVHLILDGRLSWVGRLEGVEGYLSLLVRVAEVKALLRGDEVEGFTARDVENELRTNTKVVRALIDHGLLPTSPAVNPVNKSPVALVPTEVLRAFQTEYVSLSEAAKVRGMHRAVLKRQLSAGGIEPALSADVYGATFYRRSQI